MPKNTSLPFYKMLEQHIMESNSPQLVKLIRGYSNHSVERFLTTVTGSDTLRARLHAFVMNAPLSWEEKTLLIDKINHQLLDIYSCAILEASKQKHCHDLVTEIKLTLDRMPIESFFPDLNEIYPKDSEIRVDLRAYSPNRAENRRLRRLDSLARLLSLDREHSACTAVTLYRGELIIAANVSKTANNEAQIKTFLCDRLLEIRRFIGSVGEQLQAIHGESWMELAGYEVGVAK